MQILVADDDPVCRQMLIAAVRRVQHEPVDARDGREAWEKYQTLRTRIVLSDWLMPNMTGVELCQSIRTVADTQKTYVILVTSLSAREEMLTGFAAGADDYVAKPIDLDVFAERLRAATRVIDGYFEKEETMHRQVVESCQSVIGGDRPELVPSLDALAKLYVEKQAFAKARAFLRRQIEITRKAGRLDEVTRLEQSLADIRDREDAILQHEHA